MTKQLIVTYLPWLLSAFTLLSMWLAGSRKQSAWTIGLLNQALWLLYILSLSAWGLLPMNLGMWIVTVRNWRRWRREAGTIPLRAALAFWLLRLVHGPKEWRECAIIDIGADMSPASQRGMAEYLIGSAELREEEH